MLIAMAWTSSCVGTESQDNARAHVDILGKVSTSGWLVGLSLWESLSWRRPILGHCLSSLASNLLANSVSSTFKIISQALSLLSPCASLTISQTTIISHWRVQPRHPAFSLLPSGVVSAQQAERSCS